MGDEKEIIEMIEGMYRKRYAEEHGVGSLINMYHGLPWNDKKSERVYKECLEKKITWEEYYGIDTNNDIVY